MIVQLPIGPICRLPSVVTGMRNSSERERSHLGSEKWGTSMVEHYSILSTFMASNRSAWPRAVPVVHSLVIGVREHE